MKVYIWGGATIILTLLMLYTITILEDRIVVELPSEQCEAGLSLIVHNDYTKLKCGYNVVAEWKEYVDYYRTYGEPDMWVNDYRKRTLIELKVLDFSPTYFVVRKEVPYYKGRTGTDGILYIDYTFTPDRVKWSYTFNHSNTATHRVRLKMLRFEEDYGFDFLPDDNLHYDLIDNEYYYGDVKGNLFIDPEIQVKNRLDVVKRCAVSIKTNIIKEPVYTENITNHVNGTEQIEQVFDRYEITETKKEIVTCKEYLNYNKKDTDFQLQNFKCSNDRQVVCDSCIDGNCDGICDDDRVGELCAYPTKNGISYNSNPDIYAEPHRLEVER